MRHLQFLVLLAASLTGTHATAAFENICMLSITTPQNGYSEITFQLRDVVASDPQFPYLARREVGTASTGESISVVIGRVSAGYYAHVTTPERQHFPPVPSTFFISAMAPSRSAADATQLLFLTYERANDPDVTQLDLKCYLAH